MDLVTAVIRVILQRPLMTFGMFWRTWVVRLIGAVGMWLLALIEVTQNCLRRLEDICLLPDLPIGCTASVEGRMAS
jgi:hypothetical protein